MLEGFLFAALLLPQPQPQICFPEELGLSHLVSWCWVLPRCNMYQNLLPIAQEYSVVQVDHSVLMHPPGDQCLGSFDYCDA